MVKLERDIFVPSVSPMVVKHTLALSPRTCSALRSRLRDVGFAGRYLFQVDTKIPTQVQHTSIPQCEVNCGIQFVQGYLYGVARRRAVRVRPQVNNFFNRTHERSALYPFKVISTGWAKHVSVSW